MRAHRYELTRYAAPSSWKGFREKLEVALLTHGDDTAALVLAVERLAADARLSGMRRTAFDAAVDDFVFAHGRGGPYPISETTLANVLLAASRGFHASPVRD